MNAANLYAVFYQGVYRHDCVGVFDSAAKAEDAARLALANEDDDYHECSVIPLALNQAYVDNNEPTEISRWGRTHGVIEKKAQ